jgi:hypothetical protein
MVEPVAVVLPAVFAPRRLMAFASAAAPGAATEAVTMLPAEVPQVTLLALEKFRVVKLKLPALLETTGLTPPPAATEIANPAVFRVIEALVAEVPVPA